MKMSTSVQDIDLEDVLTAEDSEICSSSDFYEKQVNNVATFWFFALFSWKFAYLQQQLSRLV